MGRANARRNVCGCILTLLLRGSASADAVPALVPVFGDRPEVKAFVQELVDRDRFEAEALTHLLGGLGPNAEVISLVAPPRIPVQRNWRVYRSRFVERVRIKAGVAFWREHAACLARAQKEFGVPAEILVGLLGVETLYGRRMGRFPVLEALATLAFDYPEAPNKVQRSTLFRNELEAYLVWCRDTRQDATAFTGSYTGAIGIPQFLPSSIRAYAVDYDGDGRIDLTNSPEDAIGSVAHYLKAQGWQPGRSILWPAVRTPRALAILAAQADGSPEMKWRVGNLVDMGVLAQTGHAAGREARAVLVDLPTPDRPTEYRIGLDNFYVITRYNRSFFYATAVVELGQAVKLAARRR